MEKKTFYQRIENWFEDLVAIVLKIYGHPFTFVVAVITVIFFLIKSAYSYTNLRDLFRDIILCISFLSFFIIQPSVNKSTIATHIKINELIASHDKANNEMVSIEEKTGTELEELANEHKKKVTNKPPNTPN